MLAHLIIDITREEDDPLSKQIVEQIYASLCAV